MNRSLLLTSPRPRRFRPTRSLVVCLVALTVGASRPAGAEATASEKATAQALFDEGRKLASSGRFAEACPKLEESLRLDPGIGTRFHLANCYERAGRTASAWTTFLEVAAAAKEAKQPEREKVARDRASALEPKLSRLTIVAGGKGAEALEIRRDGVTVGR